MLPIHDLCRGTPLKYDNEVRASIFRGKNQWNEFELLFLKNKVILAQPFEKVVKRKALILLWLHEAQF